MVEKRRHLFCKKIFKENLLPSMLIKRSKNDPLVFPEFSFLSLSSGGYISLYVCLNSPLPFIAVRSSMNLKSHPVLFKSAFLTLHTDLFS